MDDQKCYAKKKANTLTSNKNLPAYLLIAVYMYDAIPKLRLHVKL